MLLGLLLLMMMMMSRSAHAGELLASSQIPAAGSGQPASVPAASAGEGVKPSSCTTGDPRSQGLPWVPHRGLLL